MRKNVKIPLAKPSPPRLSESLEELRAIEDRAIFSNFGPLNRNFEEQITQQMFGGVGSCTTVCNATIGIILAIRNAIERNPSPRRRYALMPSFTFAAAAQAALWNQLTPLFCDIDPSNWAASKEAERALIARYQNEIAVVVPYAAFGIEIDLGWYEAVTDRYGIPVVVDAAASLGTISDDGKAFGTGFSGAVAFSMHATKSFATSEGGLLYSRDSALVQAIRKMSNYGFGDFRNSEMMGLNGKMGEIQSLLALRRLETFESVLQRRSASVASYRKHLWEFTSQTPRGLRQAHQSANFLLPRELSGKREWIRQAMQQIGVESSTYFSPHVAEHKYFRERSLAPELPVTEDVASRILSLPLYDAMTSDEVLQVVAVVQASVAAARGEAATPGHLSVRSVNDRTSCVAA